jgi:pyridoxine/pyridoxamine 5'-phosphate oxidase
MTTVLHPWAADLSDLHAQVWTRLMRGVRDRRASSRHPTLATVTPDGKPQARTVVLRAADISAGTRPR